MRLGSVKIGFNGKSLKNSRKYIQINNYKTEFQICYKYLKLGFIRFSIITLIFTSRTVVKPIYHFEFDIFKYTENTGNIKSKDKFVPIESFNKKIYKLFHIPGYF